MSVTNEPPESTSTESLDTLFPKQFLHQESERKISEFWDQQQVSRAEVDTTKQPFCVVIPPPNVTGILHMGHVLDNVPQDVMVRWHRMRGFAAVWIPGTDHAGIATQNVVKKNLEKEGINFRELGREEFLKRVWAWKEKHGDIIINQLKRLGCSCDWERERFTMDDGLARAVVTAFVQYYNKGLIYRGKRMVNWCTVCHTALSDDEVEHGKHGSFLWHLKYPLLDENGKPTSEHVVVATTRPETMLGDTAVAVHPDDERYKHLVGKSVLLPIKNRAIPIIADSFVDPKFGTGVVKLTPAHDPNDYAAAQRHSLPLEVVIGLNGKMTSEAGEKYVGLDRVEARKRVVADLETAGVVEKIEKHQHVVGECYRCKSILEPMVSDQWFVKMRPLAEKAKAVVESGKLKVVPDSEKHDYYHWMNTIQDWCISRQLWWGHRIPVYYCDSCGHTMCDVDAPAKCTSCDNTALRQDEDVLDTWFSAQLWPFSTLGWPEVTPELKFWYPNSWLMCGRDIVFFWGARMIMAGLELMGDVPFKTLVLHGLVRDSQGRKLSKSLNNSPDPLDLFNQYGTDAVRVSIALNYPMGRQDTKLGEEFFRNGQGLVIKLWNASRLLVSNLGTLKLSFDSSALNPSHLEDAWILSRLRAAIELHDSYLEKSDLVHASHAVTNFFWDEFCDWYLEIVKPRLWGSEDQKREVLTVSFFCLRTLYKLLHPYMPFVTEELWQTLKKLEISDSSAVSESSSIARTEWPVAESIKSDGVAERQMELMISVVKGVREVRQHLVIPPKDGLRSRLLFLNESSKLDFNKVQKITEALGFLSSTESHVGEGIPAGFVPFQFKGGIGYVELPTNIDIKDIGTKLNSKIEKLQKALGVIERNLKNEQFMSNAPEALVAETHAKQLELKESMLKLEEFKRSLE